jgi:hypothetical protein
LCREGLLKIDLLIDDWTNLGASYGNRADGFACADQRDGQGCAERRATCSSGHFADQALLAIEITLPFEAEQASKPELEQLPQYQTASAEVLSVIARSPNPLQPVLQASTLIAAHPCQAHFGHFRLLRDGASTSPQACKPICRRRDDLCGVLRALSRQRSLADRPVGMSATSQDIGPSINVPETN